MVSFEGERTLCLRAEAPLVSFGERCGANGPIEQAPAGGDSSLSIDIPGLSRALAKASPLLALRGQLPAAAVTAQLLFGRLLAASEPIVGTARPSKSDRASADIELRWRLR